MLGQLVDEGFFVRARKASKKQNKRQNIDLVAVTRIRLPNLRPEEVHVPFQVKSSYANIRNEMLIDVRDGRVGKVIYILVTEDRSDGRIKKDIRRETKRYLTSRMGMI